MKNIFLILFTLCSITVFAQPAKVVTRNGQLIDTSIINAPGYAKIQLNIDSIAAHNTRIGAVTVSDALKAASSTYDFLFGSNINSNRNAFSSVIGIGGNLQNNYSNPTSKN